MRLRHGHWRKGDMNRLRAFEMKCFKKIIERKVATENEEYRYHEKNGYKHQYRAENYWEEIGSAFGLVLQKNCGFQFGFTKLTTVLVFSVRLGLHSSVNAIFHLSLYGMTLEMTYFHAELLQLIVSRSDSELEMHELWIRQCEKPFPSRRSRFFLKPNGGNQFFSFWILRSVRFGFYKTNIQHFRQVPHIPKSVPLYVCHMSHLHTLVMPLDGMRCHSAGALVWSQGSGEIWGLKCPVNNDAAYKQISLIIIIIIVIITIIIATSH